MSGAWEIEYLPTLDNKWGDYRLPASNKMIGPEAPVFKYRKANRTNDNWQAVSYNDTNWRESIYGYGIQAEYCRIESSEDFKTALATIQSDKELSWQPYEFSWQFGVWFNPGPQGFHGLKNRVSNGFFILNNGAHEFFRTNVWVPQTGSYKVVVDGKTPDILLIDGKEATTLSASTMKKGWHQLLAGYGNTPKIDYERGPFDDDPRLRSMVVILPENDVVPEKSRMYDPIVSSSWAMTNHLMYSPYAEPANIWQFRIQTVPGVKEIQLEIYGEIKDCRIAGNKIPGSQKSVIRLGNGRNRYILTFPTPHESIETLALEINAERGYQGAAIMPVPVKFSCAKGKLEPGNWADQGSLRYYSGGMYYRNTFSLNAKDNDRIQIDLGNVIATCEIKINGNSAGILMSPPYKSDISQYIRQGENTVEVLIYSTLSNHYQTIPSTYQGSPDAGLMGPVNITVMRDSGYH